MTNFRRRIKEDVFVVADQRDDGSWRVDVVDVRSEPITDEPRRADALRSVLDELSSLRAHIWRIELGNPESPPATTTPRPSMGNEKGG